MENIESPQHSLPQTVPIVIDQALTVTQSRAASPLSSHHTENIVTITHVIETSRTEVTSDSETPARRAAVAAVEKTVLVNEVLTAVASGSSKVLVADSDRHRFTIPSQIPTRYEQSTSAASTSSKYIRSNNNTSMVVSSTAPVYSHPAMVQSSNYEYKSTITPRPNVICRRPVSNQQPQGSNFNNTSSAVAMRGRQSCNSPQGMVLHQTQQREKQQLSELNDRFATYIERVRFLEVQNKYLDREVGSLRSKLGLETKEIESMYKIELEAAKAILADVTDESGAVQIRLEKTENDLVIVRRRHEELQLQVAADRESIRALMDQIASNEAELGLLKRRLGDLRDEEKRLRGETVRMAGEVQRVSAELETEIGQRLVLENDKQALEEQLAFVKSMHTRELDELKRDAFSRAGLDPEEFFKNELANAIREIRKEYEAANHAQRVELDRLYRNKVADLRRQSVQALTGGPAAESDREQVKKLRTQISESKRGVFDMRAKVTFFFFLI
jgi:hypothetical protein